MLAEIPTPAKKRKAVPLKAFLVLAIFAGVVVVVAFWSVNRSRDPEEIRIADNEGLAVGNLRSIVLAEEGYKMSRSGTSYANLSELGGKILLPPYVAEPWDGAKHGYTFVVKAEDPTALKYASLKQPTLPFDLELSRGRKSGYCFVLTLGAPAAASWRAMARPVELGRTGNRFFYADQTGIVRWRLNAAASSGSPPLE